MNIVLAIILVIIVIATSAAIWRKLNPHFHGRSRWAVVPVLLYAVYVGGTKPTLEPGVRRPAPPSLSEIIQSSRIEREVMDEARERVMSGRCDHDDWIIYVLSNAGDPGTITEVDLSEAREALLRRVRQRLEEEAAQ